MQLLHARHLAALLGVLDTVEDEDGATIDLVDGEAADHDIEPELCKPLNLHRIAVEKMEQGPLAIAIQPESTDETGDAEEILADGESSQDEKKPEKARTSRERITS